MNRTEKKQVLDELNIAFRENKSVLVMGFSGLKVADATELRRKVGQAGACYRVVKNTLASRAAEETAVSRLKGHFQGPTAVVWTTGDPVALARVLNDFIRLHPELSFKGGMVESSVLSAQECQTLADLPSREVLLGKLLFVLNAPLGRLVGALQSPLRSLASVLKQLEEKKKQPETSEDQ